MESRELDNGANQNDDRARLDENSTAQDQHDESACLAKKVEAAGIAKQGDIVTLQIAEPASDRDIDDIRKMLLKMQEETGVKFIVVSNGVTLLDITADEEKPAPKKRAARKKS